MSDKPVILIVDDVPSNIKVLATCLKDQYQIKVATGGHECLRLAQAVPLPDLILLDIEMPDLGGYEVCETLKRQETTRDIPVIFVTAKDSDSNEEQGLKLGAVDYITKPVKPSIVRARVDTHVTLKQQRDLLKEIALKDQLTGIYNRYYLLEAAEQRFAHTRRHNDPMSVLILDLDHFKAVNDNFGHLKGDEVLRVCARTLQEMSRSHDIAARFGGEEFVLLLGHCDLISAVNKAEEIRAAIESLCPAGVPITTSIGAAQLAACDANIAALLERADEALYEAKAAGRNRVATALLKD